MIVEYLITQPVFTCSKSTIEKTTIWEICPKVTNTSEWRQWRCSGVFIVKFEHVSHFYLFLLLTFWTSKCRLWKVLNFHWFCFNVDFHWLSGRTYFYFTMDNCPSFESWNITFARIIVTFKLKHNLY